ncbi:MAG: hypothetical protein F2534_21590 [Actinobacteria bacterium]|uniref:Unannotated protein n=1 Tax=freshwater metagenome TaxID=449393 RepID=A0A6J6GH52_9ZZZZ|nr:hypothetical protein [Actinomycetota bacterium]
MEFRTAAADRFASEFDAATAVFCHQNEYPPVDGEWRASVDQRLPVGLRSILGEALTAGLIELPSGTSGFRLPALPGKGPYALFSRSSRGVPAPNWEYYVQLAEYARVTAAAERNGWSIGFEDDLMDVSVYQDGRLLWCIEVKERARGLSRLIQQIAEHGRALDWSKNDRGDDPLRKAKYLATRQPSWFSVVAIGERHDFSVSFNGERFELHRDVLPL